VSKFGPKKGWILVGGYNLTSDHWTLDEGVENKTEEVHPFGPLDPPPADPVPMWDKFLPVGLSKVTLAAGGGLYSDAAMKSALQAKGTTLQVVTYGLEGGIDGTVPDDFNGEAVLLNGDYVSQWKRTASRANLTKATGTHTITGTYRRGNVAAYGTFTSDGTTEADYVDAKDARFLLPTYIDDSSAATEYVVTLTPHGLTTGDVVWIAGHVGSDPDINGEQTVTVVNTTTFTCDGVDITTGGTGGTVKRLTGHGWFADLHVTALSLGGYTDVLIKLVHSDNHSSWSDVTNGAFTARNAVGAEQLLKASTLKRYVAVSHDFEGSGSSPSVSYVVAFGRL
jgi:hypothetical protein